jgi:large conductance mechanosensitive channel
MGFIKDFKNFAMKGNVIDLAVAVVIGGAFGKIVSSFVNDVIMPPIGLLLGKVDFKELKWVLRQAEEGGTDVTLNYGMFIQNVVDFAIVALFIFLAIRGIQKLEKKKVEAPAPRLSQVKRKNSWRRFVTY